MGADQYSQESPVFDLRKSNPNESPGLEQNWPEPPRKLRPVRVFKLQATFLPDNPPVVATQGLQCAGGQWAQPCGAECEPARNKWQRGSIPDSADDLEKRTINEMRPPTLGATPEESSRQRWFAHQVWTCISEMRWRKTLSKVWWAWGKRA